MFQDLVLNNCISRSYASFYVTDCSTLHPLGEVVLHDNDIIIGVLGALKGTHQVHWVPLIEGPICGLLQQTVPMNSCFALPTDSATLEPKLYVFPHAGPVESSFDKSMCMDYILVGCQLMVMAGLEDMCTNHLGHHDFPCIKETLNLMASH